MKIGESCGSEIHEVEVWVTTSDHICPDCGQRFTVTPAASDDWGGCLAPDCKSYDPSRDLSDRFKIDRRPTVRQMASSE